MKVIKWFLNNVLLNQYAGFMIGIPACLVCMLAYDIWVGAVGGFILILSLALQLTGVKPIE